jgi:hypothetical protein
VFVLVLWCYETARIKGKKEKRMRVKKRTGMTSRNGKEIVQNGGSFVGMSCNAIQPRNRGPPQAEHAIRNTTPEITVTILLTKLKTWARAQNIDP